MTVREGSDKLARAIEDIESANGFVVLSYLAADGSPQLVVPTAIHPSGAGRLSLSLSAPDPSPRQLVKIDPRVGLLYQDPLRGLTHRLAGRARPATPRPRRAGALESGPHPISGNGGPGFTLVIEVERVETTRREPLRADNAQPTTATNSRSALLEVAGLSIYYGATRAVHDLSLSVAPGEIFGLLGPNGAGKTSTLSAIEGLLRPRAGTVSLDGTDVLRHPTAARAKMGVQLQATSFQASLTIKQILRLFAGLYGVRMTDAELTATIATMGLTAEEGKPFKQLSGGQQQRLALQIAVIHKPVLLLLDEPTAGLDPQARRQLWTRIEGLRRDGGSILLTTHSMEEAQAVCDRVAIMDHGEILTSGSPAELIARHRDDPAVRAVAHGTVTLDDVFVGLTGSAIRD